MTEKEGHTAGRTKETGRKRAEDIRAHILDSLDEEEFRDVRAGIAARFDVSRQAIHKQFKRLETQQLIVGRGNTQAREHRLKVEASREARPVEGLQEYDFWRAFAEPRLAGLPGNVLSICHYGFTELVNNVVDHSASTTVLATIQRSHKSVRMMVRDEGVGIFRKIRDALGLPSLQEALFELTKGKFTTDPSRHTGEGIFYSSRVFDSFRMLSGGLYLGHERAGDGWLLGSNDRTEVGTTVFMRIESASSHTLEETFEYYSVERDDYAFNKTNVVLRLLDTGDESFISRSQAKRVLSRLPRFKEVLLDFEGVRSIAPAFADEIFRVFAKEHPDVRLSPIRASEEVLRMIERARRAGEGPRNP